MNSKTGCLYIVATPIGNLDDMTPRAIQTLKYVDLILAEDTRHSRPLLRHFSIDSPISALHDHNENEITNHIINQLTDGKTLDELLPEAFAVVREAGKRVLDMRHFDVQMIGGYVLNDGKIAEMRTGEGKTLVATLAVYLNALEGEGVHVVTVNDLRDDFFQFLEHTLISTTKDFTEKLIYHTVLLPCTEPNRCRETRFIYNA